jgi:hypothetical protein
MASLVLVPEVGHLVSFESLAGVMVILLNARLDPAPSNTHSIDHPRKLCYCAF